MAETQSSDINIVLMGPPGSGKSTLAPLLGAVVGATVIEGDSYHLPESILKMGRGESISEAERLSFLGRIHVDLAEIDASGGHAVVACSCLRRVHREALVGPIPRERIVFVLLDVPPAVLAERLAKRNHFAHPEILASQLAMFERPDDAVVIDGTKGIFGQLADICAALGLPFDLRHINRAASVLSEEHRLLLRAGGYGRSFFERRVLQEGTLDIPTAPHSVEGDEHD